MDHTSKSQRTLFGDKVQTRAKQVKCINCDNDHTRPKGNLWQIIFKLIFSKVKFENRWFHGKISHHSKDKRRMPKLNARIHVQRNLMILSPGNPWNPIGIIFWAAEVSDWTQLHHKWSLWIGKQLAGRTVILGKLRRLIIWQKTGRTIQSSILTKDKRRSPVTNGRSFFPVRNGSERSSRREESMRATQRWYFRTYHSNWNSSL